MSKVKHLVGKEFYDDKFGKLNSFSTTHKPLHKKRKHLLHSRKIKPFEELIYIEVRKHFFYNYVDFVYKVGKERKGSDDIRIATTFSKLPKMEVSRKDTFPNMKHLIVTFPRKQWKAARDKVALMEELYPKEYYPDLYPH